MPRTRFSAALLSTLLAGALLGGCATGNGDNADRATLQDFEDNKHEGAIIARLLGLDGSKGSQTQDQRPTASAMAGPVKTKLGVVITADADLQRALSQALQEAQTDYPVTLIAANEVARQLASYDCTADRIERCVSQLATYPGVQHLVVISGATDHARVTVELHHAVQDASEARRTVDLADGSGQPTAQATRALADQIMTELLATTQSIPWSTRAFKQEGGEIFIAAGARSGLKTGMELAVHGPGRAITSPNATLAGWIPGPQKGLVKITTLFGDDYAVAELLEGEAPTPADPLLLAGE